MSLIQDMLRQRACYFAPQAPDQYGNPTWASPIEIRCRWEDTTLNEMTNESEVTQTGATVYVDRDVAVHGRLLLGSLTSSTTTAGSWEIIDFIKNPRYTADQWVRKCLLRR